TAIPDSTHVDLDLDFPLDFIYGFGANMNPGEPVRWAVPGTSFYWATSAVDTIGSVKVLDVTQDADFTFVHTDQPGGFPTVTTVDGRLSVRTSIQSMQITNCLGAAPEMAQFSLPGAQNKSEYTYFKKAYTGTLTGPAGGTGLRGNA